MAHTMILQGQAFFRATSNSGGITDGGGVTGYMDRRRYKLLLIHSWNVLTVWLYPFYEF